MAGFIILLRVDTATEDVLGDPGRVRAYPHGMGQQFRGSPSVHPDRLLMIRWAVSRDSRVRPVYGAARMHRDAAVVMVDLQGLVIVVHFYLLAGILVGNTVIAMILTELDMVITLHGSHDAFFTGKFFGGQRSKQVLLLLVKQLPAAI